jgi:hypothetical protein
MYFDYLAELLRSLPAGASRRVLTTGLTSLRPTALRRPEAEARRHDKHTRMPRRKQKQ